MKHLLSPRNVKLVAQLACSNALLVFDFDGTLAPIVSQRTNARMGQRTAHLLATLCELYPCAIISGRSRQDVSARLKGSRVRYIVGNHGAEPGANVSEFQPDVARARGLLERALAGLTGVDIEDKRYSLALHYRRARHKRAARAAIDLAVAALPERMRIVPGKLVVNVVPERAANKGDALLDLRAREHADTALYVGDDITDEDVFEIDQPGRLLSVRVGRSRLSSAAYYLRDQAEVDALLSALVAFRQNDASP